MLIFVPRAYCSMSPPLAQTICPNYTGPSHKSLVVLGEAISNKTFLEASLSGSIELQGDARRAEELQDDAGRADKLQDDAGRADDLQDDVGRAVKLQQHAERATRSTSSQPLLSQNNSHDENDEAIEVIECSNEYPFQDSQKETSSSAVNLVVDLYNKSTETFSESDEDGKETYFGHADMIEP
jgi:hypothetical protein